jgi:hypothetical protein
MSMLTSLARARAVETGRAQLIRTVRHVHLTSRPLIFIPLQLAGEACAPLAAMIGDDPAKPLLLTVYEPRDRTRRFEFAAALAAAVLGYIDSFTAVDPGTDQPYPDAPQLLVPNPAGATFTRLLGRSTRFRSTAGPYAVAATVPLLGHWLTYYGERVEVTPSALLLPVTSALSAHWATGQSATEDANLAALLAWIDPPAGITGAQAALAAEDPVLSPPAGPATDPTFDNEVLDGRIKAVRAASLAGDAAVLARAQIALDAALRSQLEPTWELMWRAVDLLRQLPEAAQAADRWTADRRSFTSQAAWINDGGAPPPKRDSAVSAARRLARLEREQQRLAVQLAYDDPLVMAEYRMTGEAFAGRATAVDPARIVPGKGNRTLLRPTVTVVTSDDVTVEPGATLTCPGYPKQKAVVQRVAPAAGQAAQPGMLTSVLLELEGGFGHAKLAADGSMPALGDWVTYTTLRDEWQPLPTFPDRENTPWTHGGPPAAEASADYVPTPDDAAEDWS